MSTEVSLTEYSMYPKLKREFRSNIVFPFSDLNSLERLIHFYWSNFVQRGVVREENVGGLENFGNKTKLGIAPNIKKFLKFGSCENIFYSFVENGDLNAVCLIIMYFILIRNKLH